MDKEIKYYYDRNGVPIPSKIEIDPFDGVRVTTNYSDTDDARRESVCKLINAMYGTSSRHDFLDSYRPEIARVIFNPPATIVFWSDGVKTVVKCSDKDSFDEEKGLAMAVSKRYFGNKGNYYNNFKKHIPVKVEITMESATKAIKRMSDAINKIFGI